MSEFHFDELEVIVDEMESFYEQEVVPDDDVFKDWIDRLRALQVA